jgi:drug/metabolite transporter (DMT)-like permease
MSETLDSKSARPSSQTGDGRALGAALSALSAALFGLLGFLATTGRAHGFSAQALLVFRFGVAALALGIIARSKGLRLSVPLPVLCELALVGVVGYGATSLAVFLAYERISTSLTMTLHFFYPVTIAVGAVLLGRERFSARKAGAIVLAITGTAVILSPSGDRLDFAGIALALASAFSYAIYAVGIGSRRLASLDRFVLVFWICLFAAVAHIINAAAMGKLIVRPDAIGILAAIAMALLSTVFAIVAFAEGVRRIGPTATAILSTLEPVVTVLIGVAVLGEHFSASFAVGAVLILASAIVVVLPSRR